MTAGHSSRVTRPAARLPSSLPGGTYRNGKERHVSEVLARVRPFADASAVGCACARPRIQGRARERRHSSAPTLFAQGSQAAVQGSSPLSDPERAGQSAQVGLSGVSRNNHPGGHRDAVAVRRALKAQRAAMMRTFAAVSDGHRNHPGAAGNPRPCLLLELPGASASGAFSGAA